MSIVLEKGSNTQYSPSYPNFKALFYIEWIVTPGRCQSKAYFDLSQIPIVSSLAELVIYYILLPAVLYCLRYSYFILYCLLYSYFTLYCLLGCHCIKAVLPDSPRNKSVVYRKLEQTEEMPKSAEEKRKRRRSHTSGKWSNLT